MFFKMLFVQKEQDSSIYIELKAVCEHCGYISLSYAPKPYSTVEKFALVEKYALTAISNCPRCMSSMIKPKMREIDKRYVEMIADQKTYTDTLKREIKREQKEKKHVCPEPVVLVEQKGKKEAEEKLVLKGKERYIANLSLARDRFCKNKAEKELMDSIIKKVRKK